MTSYAADAVQYLANIWLTALQDNKLTGAEDAVLEEIRTNLKAKKSDATKARKLAESKVAVVRLTGRASDWLRNIEDMVAIALAGGFDDPWSHPSVVEAIGQLNSELPRLWEHVMAGARDVYAEQLQIDVGIVCRNCDTSNPPGAQFCSRCGARTSEDSTVTSTKTALHVSDHGITIAFAESSASTFHQALDTIRALPTFQTAEVAGKRWFAASWDVHQTRDVLAVADLVSGWRNRRVFLDGGEREWGDLFAFKWCYMRSQEPNAVPHYCFGNGNDETPWACIDLRMPWSGWSEWMQYGKFISQTEWEFDRVRIGQEIAAKLEQRRLCPRLRLDLANLALQKLPVRVHIDGVIWDYCEFYGDVPPRHAISVARRTEFGPEKVVAVGVKPVGRVALDQLYQSVNASLAKVASQLSGK